MMEKLRNNIKIELAKRGWNQAELSERAKVPQPTLNRFLTGKHREIKSPAVARIAQVFGMTEAQLRGLAEKAPPNPVHSKVLALLEVAKSAIDELDQDFSEEELTRLYKIALTVGLESSQVDNELIKSTIMSIINGAKKS